MSVSETSVAPSGTVAPTVIAQAIGRSSATTRTRSAGSQLVLPAVAAVLIASLFPVAAALFFSLQHMPNGFQALQADARFWEAVRETLFLASIALPAELLLGLALACLFVGRMPGKGMFVFLLAVPALVAPVIAGSAWQILLNNDYGPFNQILGWITGRAVVLLWTDNPRSAYVAVLIADIWQWTPFMFLLLFAALSNVDGALLEVAEVDDAGPWRMLRRIVIPAIRPAIVIAIAIRALDLLRLFDVVWTLTRGGPDGSSETLAVNVYERLSGSAGVSETGAICFATIVAVTLIATIVFGAMERGR